jgi:hypothetical protein
MGNGQGGLAEPLVTAWPRNRTGGNGAARAGARRERREGDRWAGITWGPGGNGAED